MSQTNAEVVVVGGGPAGTATALALARRGCRVIIVERSDYRAVRVGETLPPLIRPLLDALGVWNLFLGGGHQESYGIRSVWGSTRAFENDFIFNPYGHGWHVDRRRFDLMLAQAAEQAGAQVWRGGPLTSCSRTGDGGWELGVASGEEKLGCRCRLLVDATGRASSCARRLGAKKVRYDQLIGIVSFWSARASEVASDSCLLVEAVEEGWWYSAPLPGRRLVVAYMTDADQHAWRSRGARADRRGLLVEAPHTRSRLDGYHLESGPMVRAANSSRLDRATGTDWLAVGDAACALDPLSAQGVFRALESGLRAARAIEGFFAGDRDALPRYAAMVEQSFDDYLEARASYYRRETRWPDSRFWRRRIEAG